MMDYKIKVSKNTYLVFIFHLTFTQFNFENNPVLNVSGQKHGQGDRSSS